MFVPADGFAVGFDNLIGRQAGHRVLEFGIFRRFVRGLRGQEGRQEGLFRRRVDFVERRVDFDVGRRHVPGGGAVVRRVLGHDEGVRLFEEGTVVAEGGDEGEIQVAAFLSKRGNV